MQHVKVYYDFGEKESGNMARFDWRSNSRCAPTPSITLLLLDWSKFLKVVDDYW